MRSRPNSISVDTNSQPTFAVDELIKAVESFSTDSSPEKVLSDKHQSFFHHVAKTGDTLTSWKHVKEVFIQKLKKVINKFHEDSEYTEGKINNNCENLKFDDMKKILIEKAMSFENVPFTFQRLCELLNNPTKNYTRCDKYMRALDKNMKVVSSWNNTNKVSNDAPATNGTSSDLSTPVKNQGSTAMYSTFNHPIRRQNLPPSPMLTSSGDSKVTVRFPTDAPIKLSLEESKNDEEKMEVDDEVSSTSVDENSQKEDVESKTEEEAAKEQKDEITADMKEAELTKTETSAPEDAGEVSTVSTKRKLETESENQEPSEKKVKVTKEEEPQMDAEESKCEMKSSKVENSGDLVSEKSDCKTSEKAIPVVPESTDVVVSTEKTPEPKVSDEEKSDCVSESLPEPKEETSPENSVSKTEASEVPVTKAVESKPHTGSENSPDEKSVAEKVDDEKASPKKVDEAKASPENVDGEKAPSEKVDEKA